MTMRLKQLARNNDKLNYRFKLYKNGKSMVNGVIATLWVTTVALTGVSAIAQTTAVDADANTSSNTAGKKLIMSRLCTGKL